MARSGLVVERAGRTFERKFLDPPVDKDTRAASIGPVTLNVAMARRHGWSEEAINRAVKEIGRISRTESSIAHRRGPVKGCPCVYCDFTVPLKHLELLDQRIPRWRRE